jgi:hypothetical protein
MGKATPRMCSGHSMLCPYEGRNQLEERSGPVGVAMPSICAGHGMPCPQEGNGDGCGRGQGAGETPALRTTENSSRAVCA